MNQVNVRTANARAAAAAATLLAAVVPVLAETRQPSPATALVSVAPTGVAGDDDSRSPSISANGRFVAFESTSGDLVPGDTNAFRDVFVRDRKTGATTRVSVDSAGTQVAQGGGRPSISADGRFVAFLSAAAGIVPGKTSALQQVVVRDVRSGTTSLVSVGIDGLEAADDCYSPCISANGRFVAFESAAANLVAGDTNGAADYFLRDRRTGKTVRVSVDSAGNQSTGGGETMAISSGGRFVAFNSPAADLVPGDTNGQADVFVHDVRTRRTTRVSTTSAGGEANAACNQPAISANGRWVAFASAATNLVQVNLIQTTQVFLHDAKTGVTTRISGFTNDNAGDDASYDPRITPNGRFVAFTSFATNLVAGDTKGESDVFVHDVRRNTNVRASVDSQGGEADHDSFDGAVSADGRVAVFTSEAANLDPGATGLYVNVFVHALK